MKVFTPEMGTQFGNLKCTGATRKGKRKEYEAVCLCGRTTWLPIGNLKAAKSCGCMNFRGRYSGKTWDAAKVIRLNQLVGMGWTVQQIADEYAVKRNAMLQILHRYGVKVRQYRSDRVVSSDPKSRLRFDTLFNRHYKECWNYARSLTDCDDKADECIALVAADVWHKFSSHSDDASFLRAMKGFMFNAARTVVERKEVLLDVESDIFDRVEDDIELDEANPLRDLMVIYWREVRRNRIAKKPVKTLRAVYGQKVLSA